MTQYLDERRLRRNSDASQWSWKGMIPPQPRYEGPMPYFLREEQRLDLLLCPPATESHYFQRADDQRSDNDSMMPATESREPSIYQLRRTAAQHSTYSTSSIPRLMSDSASSSSVSSLPAMYNLQTYNLSSDSFGNLYTNRLNSGRPVAIQTRKPKKGTHQCLFAFDGCTDLHTRDTWKTHVNAHLSDVGPPESCMCSICGDQFNSSIAETTWSRFLDHVLHHGYSGVLIPDQGFLGYCQDKGIISEFTGQRFDTSLSINKTFLESYSRRERACTPRGFANDTLVDIPDDVAWVNYPSQWGEGEDQAFQKAIAGDIVVNRSTPRAKRKLRSPKK